MKGRAIYGSGSTWAADHFPHSRLLLGGITTRGRRGPSLPPSPSPFFIPSPPPSLYPIFSLLLLLPPFLWIEEGRWEGMDFNGKITIFARISFVREAEGEQRVHIGVHLS